MSGRDAWNPEQYERFRDERSRPFFDLLGLVRTAPKMRVVDLGCGTGELTRRMHETLGAEETLGVDTSEAMLARCHAVAGEGLRFEKGDIADPPLAGRYDLIFSNAALHWVQDHPRILARLTEAHLAGGGQLAVQVPANFDHPSHELAWEVASEPPFRDALGGYSRHIPVMRPEEYAIVLDRLGYREQRVRLEVYGHHLGGREDVIEWVKGTLLTDIARRLPPDLMGAFLERYRERLLPLLEDTRPYFYPFKRILFWAIR
jgi:trans-aconitate 2-methyltransferase